MAFTNNDGTLPSQRIEEYFWIVLTKNTVQDCNADEEICDGSENIFATVTALDRTTSDVTDWKESVVLSV